MRFERISENTFMVFYDRMSFNVPFDSYREFAENLSVKTGNAVTLMGNMMLFYRGIIVAIVNPLVGGNNNLESIQNVISDYFRKYAV